MGEHLQHFNYWLIVAFLLAFSFLFICRRTRPDKISLLLYTFYTVLFIGFGSLNKSMLFQLVMLHFSLSTAHLLIHLAIIIFKKKKKWFDELQTINQSPHAVTHLPLPCLLSIKCTCHQQQLLMPDNCCIHPHHCRED